MREIEKIVQEFYAKDRGCTCGSVDIGVGVMHEPGCGEPTRDDIMDLLLSERASARREAVEEAVKVVQDHLAKAATIRQAVAQPGMIPELSEERKREEHRIAAATIALRHPITKALRTLLPPATGTSKEVPQ